MKKRKKIPKIAGRLTKNKLTIEKGNTKRKWRKEPRGNQKCFFLGNRDFRGKRARKNGKVYIKR